MNILISGHTSGLGENLLVLGLRNNHSIYGISRKTSTKLSSDFQINADLSTEQGIDLAVNWLENKHIDLFQPCWLK